MSVEQIESAIKAMPLEELVQFADWFDAHRHELVADDTSDDLSAEQKAELLRRKESFLADPASAEPWAGTPEKIREHLHARRAQKTVASR